MVESDVDWLTKEIAKIHFEWDESQVKEILFNRLKIKAAADAEGSS